MKRAIGITSGYALAFSHHAKWMRQALPALLVSLLACGDATSAEERTEGMLSAGERIIAQRSERFEPLGREVVRIKILDPATMQIREVGRDRSGQAIDYGQIRSEARLAFQAEHGAAHPALVERLASMDEAPIDVAIEIKSKADLEAVEADVRALGGEILEQRWRVLVARANRRVVREISRLARVLAVLPHQPSQNLALNSAHDLVQEPLAAAHRLGAGVGFKVAVWEPEACVNRDHPDFNEVVWLPRDGGETCDVTNRGGHSTAVAGVLAADRGSAGTAGLFRGQLFDINDSDIHAVAAMWARRPELVNASFSVRTLDAKMIDEEVYRRGIFVFNGAGNNANETPACELDEIAYCYAYNALCIGGYNHQSTIVTFGDDAVTNYSNYCNDPVSGRESPQVLGPYSARTAHWSGSGYSTWGGTSMATPGVTGLAALLLANYPLPLWKKPALMRAVLMASAQAHSIIDRGRRFPDFDDGIDDRMGVGAPNGDRAKAIMGDRSYRYKRATPQHLGLQASFTVGARERVRVLLAWDQCPGYSVTDPDLKVDLDLAVRAPGFLPNRKATFTNPSFVDNWEVVEFVTWRSGTVDIHVSAARFDVCAAEGNQQRVPIAVAWTRQPAGSIVIQR